MPIQIQSNTFNSMPYSEGCNPNIYPCDIVTDLYKGVFKDLSRQAVFQNNPLPTQSLYSLYSPSYQQYGVSEMFNNPNQNLGQRMGEYVYTNVAMPFNEKGDLAGVRVMSRQLPLGSGRGYTSQISYTETDTQSEFFLITQEMIDATNGQEASPNIGGTYTDNRLVLPVNLSHLVSDNTNFGCGKGCCGEGWRIWYIEKAGCETEVVWVRATPPENYQGNRNLYGPLYENQEDPTELTGYGVYMVRGMGKEPKPGSTSVEQQDFGTPNIICVGDKVVIGPMITTSKNGCLACSHSTREVRYKQDYVNYTQKMHGTVMCLSAEDFYTPDTFHRVGSLHTNFISGLKKIHHEIGYTLEFGQKTMGAGLHDLTDALHPGVGNSGAERTPYTTDGWITQIMKNAKVNHMTIYVKEDDCDNPCFVDMINEAIGNKIRNLPYRPMVAFGSSFLDYFERRRITNMYASNIDSLEKAFQLDAVRKGNISLYGDTSIKFLDNPMAGSDVKFSMIKIADKLIPFMVHHDLMIKEPGMIIIMPQDAPRIVTPAQNPLQMAGQFLKPTAVPGLPIPTFYDTSKYTNVLNGSDRGGRFMAENECPIEIKWYLEAGADYEPTAYPYTFVLNFKGVKNDGTIVPISELTSCTGCFTPLLNMYKQLRGEGSSYVNNMHRPIL